MRRSDDLVRFEGIEPGTTIDCGSTIVSELEIVEFAERYDLLEIHMDPSAAAESHFGGIIASGYHTLCLLVRFLVEGIRTERAVVGGLGIDDVRWHQPAEPGDTISVKNEILDTRLLKVTRAWGSSTR
ncbi:MaoC/PaaZ C-terminal domain-containing protein [Halalkalicoccus subterraneus]|uniref:MaoC/PaaZ C-terminal domain-containing protein n=1 Tax=Halalkalicoccus subterraneus TaxID=2675002 RepID=UPI001B86816A|nr:MaoC/PaaZ C-terminal domain-containing protein [Halalkalicoccus subterraneus]